MTNDSGKSFGWFLVTVGSGAILPLGADAEDRTKPAARFGCGLTGPLMVTPESLEGIGKPPKSRAVFLQRPGVVFL